MKKYNLKNEAVKEQIECFKWHYQQVNAKRKYKLKTKKSNDKRTLQNIKRPSTI